MVMCLFDARCRIAEGGREAFAQLSAVFASFPADGGIAFVLRSMTS